MLFLGQSIVGEENWIVRKCRPGDLSRRKSDHRRTNDFADTQRAFPRSWSGVTDSVSRFRFILC